MKKTNTQSHIESFDDLALVIKAGFDGVDEQFVGVNQRLDKVEKRLDGVETELQTVVGRLDRVDTNQQELKLRQDNVAYRFEINELNQRVFVLETHAGLAK